MNFGHAEQGSIVLSIGFNGSKVSVESEVIVFTLVIDLAQDEVQVTPQKVYVSSELWQFRVVRLLEFLAKFQSSDAESFRDIKLAIEEKVISEMLHGKWIGIVYFK